MDAKRNIVAITLFFLLTTGYAAVPGSIGYQAYLTEPDGTPINRHVLITFSIYNTDIGGSPLWMYTQVVSVDQGLLSVDLGNPVHPFPPGLFDAPLWLGIQIDSDAELLPRRPLTSVGFAFEADNAASLQGQGPAAFDQSEHVGDMANPHGVDAAQVGAASPADILNLQLQLDAALASIASLQADLTAANTMIAGLQVDLANETTNRIADVDAEEAARIADVDAEETARMAADAAQNLAIAAISTNSVLQLDGVLSLTGGSTALFNGVNLQVTNGTGTTDSEPNGVGNVIVGYNTVDTDAPICSLGNQIGQIECETNGGVWAASHKSGSHNIIVGDEHNYSRFGGLVVGLDNNITGDWASISGGQSNQASFEGSMITGGSGNTIMGDFATIIGGDDVTCLVDACGEGVISPPNPPPPPGPNAAESRIQRRENQ